MRGRIKTKDSAERDKKISVWHSEGMTQREIGEKLGVTYQRVQQIEKSLNLPKSRGQQLVVICAECGKKFASSRQTRKFCSHKCFSKFRRIRRTPREQAALREKKRLRSLVRSKAYYHGVFKKKPNWSAIVRERNQKAKKHL